MANIYDLSEFTKPTAFTYYLLGAFITDGCMSSTGQSILSSNDKEWLEEIRNRVCPGLAVYKQTNGNCWTLALTNSTIYKWLLNHGCTPKKSLTLLMPQVPNKYFFDFLRGCIDGDGSISTYTASKKRNTKTYYNFKSQAYICSSSSGFIEALKHRLDDLGICGVISCDKPKVSYIRGECIETKNPVYRLYFGYRKCFDLLTKVYYDDDCFCLKRKQVVGSTILQHYQPSR